MSIIAAIVAGLFALLASWLHGRQHGERQADEEHAAAAAVQARKIDKTIADVSAPKPEVKAELAKVEAQAAPIDHDPTPAEEKALIDKVNKAWDAR